MKRFEEQGLPQMLRGIVAFDLDGTVYANRTDTYPTPRVATAFEAAHKAGFELVVATGRPASHLKPHFRNAPWLGWIIASSGASLYRAQATEPIFRLSLDYEVVGEACALVGDAAYRRWLDTPEGFVCELPEVTNARWTNPYWVPPNSVVADNVMAHPYAQEGIQKLMFHFMDETSRTKALTVLKNALRDRAEVAGEGGLSLEVSPLGASKGLAAMQICELTGAPAENSVAFGDSGNDCSFIDTPITFVAMESAEACILERADDICPDVHHDGVAVWLEKNLLNMSSNT